MIFEPLAFLRPEPIHEEPILPMDFDDGHDHVADDGKRGDAARQSSDQKDASKKLPGDAQKGESGRNAQLLGEKMHRAAPSKSAEPAQHQLTAMSEEKNPQHKSR